MEHTRLLGGWPHPRAPSQVGSSAITAIPTERKYLRNLHPPSNDERRVAPFKRAEVLRRDAGANRRLRDIRGDEPPLPPLATAHDHASSRPRDIQHPPHANSGRHDGASGRYGARFAAGKEEAYILLHCAGGEGRGGVRGVADGELKLREQLYEYGDCA